MVGSDATARASSRSARRGKASSSARSARRWRRAGSTSCRIQGERLPLVDDSAAGEWALAYRMLREPASHRPGSRPTRRSAGPAAAGRAAGARGCRGHVAAGSRTVAPWVRAPRRGGERRDRAAQRRGADGSPASTAAGPRGGAGAARGGVRRLTPADRAPHARYGQRTPPQWPVWIVGRTNSTDFGRFRAGSGLWTALRSPSRPPHARDVIGHGWLSCLLSRR